MSCVFDKERLTAFFDGELDAEERAETERHISGCSECLRDLGEIKSAASAVKTLARPRAPRSIAEGVAREIAVAGRVRRIDLWRRRAVWAVGAAAILLVTLNVMFFTRAPEPDALAKAAPVTGIGAQLPSDADDKSLQRDAAKASSEEKDAVDKLGADNRARRAAEGGRELMKKAEADRQPGEANALRQDGKSAAPTAPAPTLAAKAEKAAELKPDAPKSEAPARPAPPPAPAAAPAPRPLAEPAAPPAPKPAPVEEERRKLLDTKADKAGALEKRTGDPAAAPKADEAAAAPAYTVRGAKAAQARAQAEALAKSWSAAPEPAAKPSVASGSPKAATRSFGSESPAPLVLDVTPEQFEQLRAELAKAGVTVEAGAPAAEGLLRGGAKDAAAPGGGAAAPAAGKERAEQESQDAEKKQKAAATRRVTLHFVVEPAFRAKDK